MNEGDGLQGLRDSLRSCRVIKFGGYDYFVHPIADGIPALEPSLLGAVAGAAASRLDPSCGRILTVEAMGIPLGTAVSLRTGKPLTIVRKKGYGLEGEIKIGSRTGYSSSILHLNGLGPGDRVAFVDDVLSTGGTVVSVVQAVRRAGGEVRDALVVIDKSIDRASIEEKVGLRIKSLVKVRVENGVLEVR